MRCSTNFMSYPFCSRPPSSHSACAPPDNSNYPILATLAPSAPCASALPSSPCSTRAASGTTLTLVRRRGGRPYWISSGWVRLYDPSSQPSPNSPVVPTGFTPSRTQLLLLDLLIIALSVIVATLAYETTYARAVTKAVIRATLDLTPAANTHAYTDPLTPTTRSEEDSDVVLDFRSSLLVRHVRYPPSPPPEDTQLPNGAAVVEGLRVLLQAQRALRTQTEGRQAPSASDAGGDDVRGEERERRVPGGMDPPEDEG